MRLAEVRALTALGLGGAALESVARLPAEIRGRTEFADLQTQLRSAPSGRASWEALRPRFEANLSAWSSRGGDADRVAQAWRAAGSTLDLFRCADGNFQVSRVDDAGHRQWLPRLLDHRTMVARTPLPEFPPQTMPPTYLLEGIKQGGLLTRLWADTNKTFLSYRPALYVIEPNALAVAVAMHLTDLREVLTDPRVLLFTGSDAASRWADLLRDDDCWPVPGQVVQLLRWGPVIDPSLEAVLSQVADDRVGETERLKAQATEAYRACDPAHWRERFERASRGEPLRVLLPTSRFTTFLQYSTRDIAAALREIGCDVRLMIERDDWSLLSSSEMLRTIREFRPDLILLLDHLRHEYRGFYPASLPFVTWIQDMLAHLTCRKAGDSVGPFDFVIGHGLRECVLSFGYPPDQFMPCQIPTNARTFHAGPCSDEELALYRCDAAYVGTGSKSPRMMHEEFIERNRLNAAFQSVLEQAYQRLEAIMSAPAATRYLRLGDVLRESAAAVGANLTAEQMGWVETNYVAVVADRMYRFQTLEWVAAWAEATGRSFRLYGPGWESMPQFARHACGPIENGEPLRRLYQATKFNVHCNLHGTIHQRLLDGLSSGGFFLVRYHPADFTHEALRLRIAWMRTVRERMPGTFRLAEHAALRASFDAYPDDVRNEGYPLEFVAREDLLAGAELTERVSRRSSAGAVVPALSRVTFRDSGDFAACAERYIGDDELRASTAREMREQATATFSYEGILRELITELAGHFRRLSDAPTSHR